MASELEKLLAMGSMAATGGYTQAALGGVQALYGLAQLPKAKAEFDRARAAAPSLETPSQFYENYRNAYDSTLASMQNDAIQANLSTSIQALQGAGGRALVGGLSQATNQAQQRQNQMMAQERQLRMAAGQQLAAAEERAIGRKEQRSNQQQAYANQAYQAALGNVGAGLGTVGEGLMYAVKDGIKKPKIPNLKKEAVGGQDPVSDAINTGIKNMEYHQSNMEASNIDQIEEEAEITEDFKGNLKDIYTPKVGAIRSDIAASQPSPRKTPQANIPNSGQYFGAPLMKSSAIFPELDFAPADAAAQALEPAPERAFEENFPVTRVPAEYSNEQALKQLNALGRMYRGAGSMPLSFKAGGMMTNGSFSHETNPINIMQDGMKVGEMTGGEYIINPTQANRIAKESSFAKKLFKRFEKNAKKNK